MNIYEEKTSRSYKNEEHKKKIKIKGQEGKEDKKETECIKGI
jgi:ribosomal protein S13